MILYKNYIRILGSYVFIFIRECGCNYKVNVLCGNAYIMWKSSFDWPYQKYVISEVCQACNYIWR